MTSRDYIGLDSAFRVLTAAIPTTAAAGEPVCNEGPDRPFGGDNIREQVTLVNTAGSGLASQSRTIKSSRYWNALGNNEGNC